jgi:sulfoxide reductase heme-binding subunit YedZ
MAPPRGRTKEPLAWLKPGILAGSLVPLASILIGASRGKLGANPVAEALNELGLLALVFLIASLACTPMKIVWGVTWPIRIRRMLGLLAFFYASLHLFTYAALDQGGNLRVILEDVTKRKFITVGFSAWILLVPLAVTSTSRMVKRLGFARWKRLHRLAYVTAILAIVHFVWRVKKDVTEPAVYAVLLGMLLALRIFSSRKAPAREAA